MQPQQQKKQKKPVEFPALPCLTKGLNASPLNKQDNNNTNIRLYKNCLNQKNKDQKDNDNMKDDEEDEDPNQLKPGWIQLIPGKDYSIPETPRDKRKQQQKQEQNTPHYIMSQTAHFVSSQHIQQDAYERYAKVVTPNDSPDEDEDIQPQQGQQGQQQESKKEDIKIVNVKWFSS